MFAVFHYTSSCLMIDDDFARQRLFICVDASASSAQVLQTWKIPDSVSASLTIRPRKSTSHCIVTHVFTLFVCPSDFGSGISYFIRYTFR